jgi:glycosyltransferase involved in cell wall biosynthesis
MKICFISVLYSRPQESGGLGAHIAGLSAELVKRGHQVTVLTSGNGSPCTDNGVAVVQLGKVDRFSRSLDILDPIHLVRRLSYMLRVTRYVLDSDFDVVEAADGGLEQLLLTAHRNRRCGLVTKLHGNFHLQYPRQRLLGYWVEKLERLAVRGGDAVYSSTVQCAERAAKAYGIPVEKIRIIPCGINAARIRSFERQDLGRQYPRIRGKRLVLLSVGSSPERKGAPVFLEAASEFQREDVLFVLLCNDSRFLKRRAIPSNVLVLANLNQCQFYNWIQHSEIMVFPSAAETFSIAVHEAMLLNKIIVLSSTIPFEGIDREYPRCFILPNPDSRCLADAVSDITSGRKQFPELGVDLQRRLIAHYALTRVTEDTVGFYAEASKHRGLVTHVRARPDKSR